MKSLSLLTGVLIPTLAILSSVGCFNSPDMNSLKCTTSARCPTGNTCVIPAGKFEGLCERSADGSTGDVAPVDGTPGVDAIRAADAASSDGVAQSVDGLAQSVEALGDTGGNVDLLGVSPDSSPDTVPDKPIAPDPGSDATTDIATIPGPDVPLDIPLDRTPDVSNDLTNAPDLPPDLAADVSPDLAPDLAPPAPDLGPDLPLTKPKGATCSLSTECSAGLYCTDGVCCTTQSTCGTCHACNLTGTLGACSPVAQGTSDPTCQSQASAANCTAAVCNSSGACQALASGTSCGTVCTNDQTAGVVAGQWYSTSVLRNKKCNGIAAGASGCVTDNVSVPPGCTAGLTCASSTACKSQCFTASDCSAAYYCNAGTCTLKGGACSDAIQCANGACTGTFAAPNPHCEVCAVSGYSCPITTPTCQLSVSTPGCVACNPAAQYCNADGSVNCPAEVCPSNAPDCGADNHCHCGSGGSQCGYAGQVCTSGQCKMGGGWPCVNATDCAYGTCTGGVCPQTPSGGLCTQLKDGECASGNCSNSFKCP